MRAPPGALRIGASVRLRLYPESAPLEQAEHERHHGHDHKHKEQNLCDAHSTRGNAAKAKNCGHQRDHQKNNCVMQHHHLPKSARALLAGATNAAPSMKVTHVLHAHGTGDHQHFTAAPGTREELGQFIAAENTKWARIIRERKITAD
eukprot:gene32159-39716_t